LSIPTEYAWIVSIVVPLVIGLFVGAIVKRTFKLVILIGAFVIILVATRIVSLIMQDIYDKSMEVLPKLFSSGQGLLNVLPYASTIFLIGLAIGLWKG